MTPLLALLATAQGFVLPTGLGSAQSRACSSRPVVCKVDYDKTKEGDYPHPHDEDYKFGGVALEGS